MPLPHLRAALAVTSLLLCQLPVQASVDIWNTTSSREIAARSAIADPADPYRLLVATEQNGLYLSEDGGKSWNPVTGLDALYITAMEFDPARPGRVYAGDRVGQFFVSDNGGRDWIRLLEDRTPPGGGNTITEIHPTGSDGERLYLVWGGQLLETRDGGSSWREIPLPLLEDDRFGPVPGVIETLAVAPDDPDVLVAIRDEGIYRSSDAGANWAFAPLALPRFLDSLAISPADSRRVVAGSSGSGELWASDDGGRQWYQQPSVSLRGLSDLHFHASGRLYATTAAGLYYSNDAGVSWQASSAPQEFLEAVRTVGSLIQVQTWYRVGVGAGEPVQLTVWPAQILISPDAGQSWELLPTRVEEDRWPEPSLNERLYRGSVSGGSFATGVNLYRSDDGGDSWILAHQFFIPIGEESEPIPDMNLVWRDETPDVLYTGVAPPRYQQEDPGRGLLRSTDGGASWSLFGPFEDLDVQAILLDPEDAGFIAVGGGGPLPAMAEPTAQVAWSGDGGQGWLRATIPGASRVNDLLRDPLNASGLLVATDRGVFRVVPGEPVVDLTARPDWPAVAIDGAPERLVAAIAGDDPATRGVAVSTDGGASWLFSAEGLLTDRALVGLVMDPVDPGHLWAAVGTLLGNQRGIDKPSDGGMVYESLDGGLSWQALDTGLIRNQLGGLRLSPSGAQLLTGGYALPLQRSVLWWDPRRSGMGVALEQNGDEIWGTLYYYDAAGEARWALFNGSLQGLLLEAELLSFSGPAPGEPWDMDQVRSRPVGRVSLQFQSALAGRLEVELHGVADSLVIQPFMADAGGPGNHIWWQPDVSGQGLAVVQRGNSLTGAWYFYDAAGEPTWRLFEGEMVDGTLDADLLDFSGSALGETWDPGQVSSAADGRMRFSLMGSRAARFEYTRAEHGGSLQLQPFMR